MIPIFTDDHLLLTVVGNAIWTVQASHNSDWVAYLGGVKVHGHGEGAAIDFFVVHLNMEFVLASTHCCVRHLVSGGRHHGYW